MLMNKPFNQSKKTIGFRIIDLMRHMGITMDHVLSINKIPIASNQAPLLMLSAQFEGHSMKDLASIVKKDKAGILRGLRSLEKRGLIRFQDDYTDMRKRLVYLTPIGNELVERIFKQIEPVEKQMIAGVTAAELENFYKVIDKIKFNCLKNIGKEDLDDFCFDEVRDRSTAKNQEK
jgi:DNA-binding MarR family transcriptional regulator